MMKKMVFGIKLTVAVLLLVLNVFEAKAAWGDFDTSFGFQGAAFDNVTGHYPRNVTLQPDGKILVTGYRIVSHSGERFFLRRYLANGSLDTAFGTNGAAIGPESNTPLTDYRGDGIVVLPDGKIAVAGWANGYTAVWQFNSNGKVDKTFGDYGLKVLTGYPVLENAFPELNIQRGKLLLSIRKQVSNDKRIALVRLTSTGEFDPTFGSSGESLTSVYGGDKGSGTVVDPNEKITIGGIKYNDLSAKGLERKLANGQHDTGFNPPTIFSFSIVSPGMAKTVNGKYILRWLNLAGNGSLTVSLQKFTSAGVFDGGLSPYNGFQTSACPEIFTSQNDGKLIVQSIGMLFRTDPELTPGSTEYNYCSNLTWMTSESRAALQPDDKMVAAGVYNNDLVLVRTLPD